MNTHKIKILQIGADNLGFGGRSVIVFNLTQQMEPSLVQNDFLCFKEQDREYERLVETKGGKIQYVMDLPDKKNRLKFEYIRFKKIAEIIKRNQYDIVHIHADHAYEALKSAVVCKSAGCNRIIVHAHTTGNDEKDFVAKRILIKVCQLVLPLFCCKTFACSKEAAAYLFGKVPDDITILKNGIDLDAYAFDEKKRMKAREMLSLHDEVVIGCVGRLSPPKNYPYLLNVFRAYRNINNNSVLMIAGDGPLKKDLIKTTENLGIAEHVYFLGNRKDVPDLLQAFDVFVLTSLYEGFGIVNIEAQAAGLPCVVSDVVPKIAKVNEDFTFVDLNEPPEEWAKIIFDSIKRERKKTSASLRSAGFDITSNAVFLEEIYNDLVFGDKI